MRIRANEALILALAVTGALAALTLGGCGGGGDLGTAEPPSVAPPDRAEILAQRESKDRRFKTQDESAIPPELRDEFTGLEYYPFDPSWQFVVHLDRRDEPKPFTITTTEGEQRPAVTVGTIEFERGGNTHSLHVYSLRDLPAEAWDSLFLPFMDATTGEETYPAGRYVELENVGEGWYLLDFNQAYNPLCAYGREIYRCPRTPPENELPIAVRAGEKGWGVPGADREESEG
jgi:hypothetical protein